MHSYFLIHKTRMSIILDSVFLTLAIRDSKFAKSGTLREGIETKF